MAKEVLPMYVIAVEFNSVQKNIECYLLYENVRKQNNLFDHLYEILEL